MEKGGREKRLDSILQKLIGEYITKESGGQSLITIIRIEISPSRRVAKVFCTIYPEEEKEKALQFLQRKQNDIYKYVRDNGRLKDIPAIRFFGVSGTVAKW